LRQGILRMEYQHRTPHCQKDGACFAQHLQDVVTLQ
jgi:hypothetical protein